MIISHSSAVGGSRSLCSSIYHSTTRTRSSTLQDRIGAHQNGSTSVRSTEKLPEELHPVHRPAGDEENFEANYLYELESKRTIASDMKELVDYAAKCMAAFSSWWSSGSAAERQFGDSGSQKLMVREERRSRTSKIDPHGEFDSRSVQPIPVKEVASQNEPTPPVLLQLFRLDWQTGHLQGEQAEQAEEFEKESRFEYLADDLSHELKAMKSFVATMGAMHKKSDGSDPRRLHLHPEYRQAADYLSQLASIEARCDTCSAPMHFISNIIHIMSCVSNLRHHHHYFRHLGRHYCRPIASFPPPGQPPPDRMSAERDPDRDQSFRTRTTSTFQDRLSFLMDFVDKSVSGDQYSL